VEVLAQLYKADVVLDERDSEIFVSFQFLGPQILEGEREKIFLPGISRGCRPTS
jgi:hypothetical protein